MRSSGLFADRSLAAGRPETVFSIDAGSRRTCTTAIEMREVSPMGGLLSQDERSEVLGVAADAPRSVAHQQGRC